MSMEWYRAYHGMPYDPKLQVIAKRAGQPMAYVVAVWMCMLDAASQHDPRGIAEIDPEEIAVTQGIELEAVEAIFDAFKSKNMLDDENHVVSWHKRQHTTSTERSKKSRSNKKQDATDGNAVQRGATKRNGSQRKSSKKTTDTDTDLDTDSEKNTDTEKDSDKKKKERERRKRESVRGKNRKLLKNRSQRKFQSRCWRFGMQKSRTD